MRGVQREFNLFHYLLNALSLSQIFYTFDHTTGFRIGESDRPPRHLVFEKAGIANYIICIFLVVRRRTNPHPWIPEWSHRL